MQGPNTNTKSFKQAFLKNLLLALQLHTRTTTSFGSGAMSFHERNLAVKSSLDVAMAAAHDGGVRWPSAILAAVSPSSSACKVQRCRAVVRRCCRQKRSSGGGGGLAWRLVRSRTMALREVIPGGHDDAVDEPTLLREAMDYAMHLRSQVDVLRWLSEAMQTSSTSHSDLALRKEA